MFHGLRDSFRLQASRQGLADSKKIRGAGVVAPLLLFVLLSAGIGTVGHCYFAYQVRAFRTEAERDLSAIADLKEKGLTTGAVVTALALAAAAGVVLWGRRRDAQWLQEQLALEREHRLILDSAEEGILGLDSQGRHVFANAAACRMLGRGPEELIGKFSHPTWHHRKADGAPYPHEECPILKTFREGKPFHCDQEVFWRKDGTSFPVEYTSTPSAERGRPVATVLVFRDITERKRIEVKLRAINDAALDAIIMMDARGNVAHWNPAAERMFGYSSAEIMGRRVHDVLAPAKYREQARQGLSRFRQSGERPAIGRTLELEACRKDGSLFPIAMSVSTVRMDGLWWAVATVRDISDQKALEAKRTRSLSQLEQLSRLQEELILPGGIDGKFKRITDAAVEILDLDLCRIWVARPADLCHAGCIHADATEAPHACRRRDKCLHLLSSSGRYTHIDGDHRRVPFGAYKIGRIADGQDKRFLTNQVATDPRIHNHQWATDLGLTSFAGYRLRDSGGQPIGVLAVFSKHPLNEEDDAFLANLAETTSKAILDGEAERELQEAKDIAEAATRAKSCFLANISHEIRTPMTAILGFADVLLDELQEPDAREAAGIIKRNGEHLLTIINDILDISKIEAGKVELEMLPWSPRQIVAEVVSLLHVRAEAKGLTLVDEYAGPLPETIITDPTRLRQVLLNVVGNAVKFTENGGVRIVTRLINLPGSEPKLRFDVIDTGIGIPEDCIEQIFEPFTQVDDSNSRRFEGTGLGLTISRRFARMLGGDITAQSSPGNGSTFSVTVATGPLDAVPLVECRAGPSRARNPSVPSTRELDASPPCRVLLAEDIPDNQRLIALMLGELGADVAIAQSGQEAVEMALAAWPGATAGPSGAARPFDVVFMDVQMPVLDGLEATRRLRREGYAGPIVALTAHAMRGDRQKCLDAGCDDYLTKPIDQKRLRDVLRRWTFARSARAETDEELRSAGDDGAPLPASAADAFDSQECLRKATCVVPPRGDER